MTEGPAFSRPAWVAVDLGAVRANIGALAASASPAALLATVKADAYGHGAVPVALAAVEAGAAFLGVAFVEEGIELRDAGIDAPILLLSEPPPTAAPAVIAHQLTPLVYTVNGIDALAKAVVDTGASPHAVHLKVDTGMHRVGCAPADAVALAEMIAARDELRFEGLATHLAVADELDSSYTDAQLDAFDAVIDAITDRVGRPAVVHAANSAGLLAHPRARYDLVRAGIALYGITPVDEAVADVVLRPALSLHARVSFVKQLDELGCRLDNHCVTQTNVDRFQDFHADAGIKLIGALRSFQACGMLSELLGCLEDTAILLDLLEMTAAATRLFAAVDASRQRLALARPPRNVLRWNGALAAVRKKLGGEAFQRHWTIGETWELAEAVKLAKAATGSELLAA